MTDKRRRRLLKAVGVAVLPGVAGCAEQSDGGAPGATEDGETPTTEAEPTPTEAATPTETAAETATPTETATETVTPTETTAETATPTETATETTTAPDSVTLVLDNVGAQAWELTEDESGTVAPLNENNPTLTLETGRRYTVENRGWSAHPLAFRASDDSPLLSQSADGAFESDDAVDWVDDGETVAFTVTEELAAELDYYICTVHPGMRGSVESA